MEQLRHEHHGERRKQPRFKVAEGAFAVCWSSPIIIGQIIDVSQFGISFRYIADQIILENQCEIGIMFSETNFFLEKILFESVSDILIPGPPESTLEIRRHSGHFLSPTPAQQQKLELFVQLVKKGVDVYSKFGVLLLLPGFG